MAKHGRVREKQPVCRICKKRPPWRYKNCPPGICKRCYHQRIWADRPAARAVWGTTGAIDPEDAAHEVVFDGFSGACRVVARIARDAVDD
jgi:hypothetical protein